MEINFTLIAAAMVFLVFLLVMMKFIWPPLMAAIEDRQKRIADGLIAADAGQEKLKSAESEANKILRNARNEAQELVNACEMRRVALINEAKSEAKLQCDILLSRSKSGIAAEVEQAKAALQNQVASLAIAAASQILGREVNAGNHDELLKNIAQKL